VQIEGRLRKPEDFRSLVIARRGGALIPLEEIAEVVDGAEEEESLALLDGRRAVAVEVVKVQDANTIEVVDRLYAQLAEIRKGLPPDIVIDIVRDS
ncbi:efflux RND transporter permease subunit, partial [Klebsiella pneumoniae]